MIAISKKISLPNKQTRAYELLELTAIAGELPIDLLDLLSSGRSYTETVVTRLRQQGLIKTYYKDGRRGLRPTTTAKKLLLADNPERFSAYMSENADTNHIRCEPSRRERLHRIAEATVTMKHANVSVFRDERPAIFTPIWEGGVKIQSPAFYSSREIKELGYQFAKVKGARSVGVLLTAHNIFITYSLGNSLIKWSYRSELRTKALMQNLFCLERFPNQYTPDCINGILLSNSMDMVLDILNSSRQQYLILDDNYENFYFLTNDEKGEMLLRLLCRPDLCEELDEILTDDLYPAHRGSLIDHDAETEDGRPVLLAYKCDLKRIRKFDTALTLQEKTGIIICFDYQADVLRRYCSDAVDFQTLDYEKAERRFFS